MTPADDRLLAHQAHGYEGDTRALETLPDRVGVEAELAQARAEVERLRESAEDIAGALALMLHDAHPTYGNTAGWRGGIGGSAITQGCSVIDPPPGAEWAQYDLLSEPLRRYMNAHQGFDLAAAKERVKAAARAALTPTTGTEQPS